MPRATPATLRAADFLILEALTRKPMNTTELGRALQISYSAVRDRIKRFKEMGLIIKQYPDRRWVIKLIIRVETPRETAELLGAEIPNLPPKQRTLEDPDIVKRRALQKVPVEPQEVAQEVVREVPDLGAIEEPQKPVAIKEPRVPVSENALKISKQFRVPAHLRQMGGEVAMGKMGTCKKCARGTPFRYGEKHLCPLCARSTGGR